MGAAHLQGYSSPFTGLEINSKANTKLLSNSKANTRLHFHLNRSPNSKKPLLIKQALTNTDFYSWDTSSWVKKLVLSLTCSTGLATVVVWFPLWDPWRQLYLVVASLYGTGCAKPYHCILRTIAVD
jgi:hypothetical protein